MEIAKNIINQEEVIVSPDGHINFTNSQDFKNELINLLDQGYRMIIVDFNSVESIDSSGLGKLLMIQKKLKNNEGKLIIRNVNSDYIRNMFEMINLDKIIEIES